VRTAVSQFVCKFGGELRLQLLQLADYVLAWTISWLWFGIYDELLFGGSKFLDTQESIVGPIIKTR
jgi:hypothetical protein